MMIFKNSIPRRKLLRGIGAAVSLPLLDGMFPALASPAETASNRAIRFGTVFAPNGMWPMDKWTPKTEGAGFALTPTLEPLAKFRDRILVLSGLGQKEALPLPGEGSQDHERASGTFLTGVRVKAMGRGCSSRLRFGMDQIAASDLGKNTQRQFSARSRRCLGKRTGRGMRSTASAVLTSNTIPRRTPTMPMPMERQPRAVFERLFGDSDTTDAAQRAALLRSRRSLLDWVAEDVSHFVSQIGPADRVES